METIKTPSSISTKWVQWRTKEDTRTCAPCKARKNQVMPTADASDCPLHPNCRCRIESVKIKIAGGITKERKDGADYWVKKWGKLPERYITKDEAIVLGWVRKRQNLEEIAPGKVFGGHIFTNRKQVLPNAPGRIWYEADVNSTTKERGLERIVYSNDGLMFYTDDHYTTFFEISYLNN